MSDFFDIKSSGYGLWSGSTHNASGGVLTSEIIQNAFLQATNPGVWVFKTEDGIVHKFSTIKELDDFKLKQTFNKQYNNKLEDIINE